MYEIIVSKYKREPNKTIKFPNVLTKFSLTKVPKVYQISVMMLRKGSIYANNSDTFICIWSIC